MQKWNFKDHLYIRAEAPLGFRDDATLNVLGAFYCTCQRSVLEKAEHE